MSLTDIAREPLILYDPGSSYFALITEVCQRLGIEPKVQMNLDSVEATKHMVALGLGIGFLPKSAIGQDVAQGALSVVPLENGQRVLRPTHVLVRRTQHYNPAVLAFLRELERLFDADLSWVQDEKIGLRS